jgi:hypothetical protein
MKTIAYFSEKLSGPVLNYSTYDTGIICSCTVLRNMATLFVAQINCYTF